MLDNLTIGRRIALGFVLILLLAVIGTVAVTYKVDQMNAELDQILGTHMRKIEQARLLRDTGSDRSLLLRNILLTEDEGEILTIKEQFGVSVDQYSAGLKRLQEMIEAGHGNDREREIIQKILEYSGESYPVVFSVIQNTVDGFGEESRGDLKVAARIQNRLIDQLAALVALEKQNIDRAMEHFRQLQQESLQVVLVLFVVALFAVILIGFKLSQSIRQPTARIREVMEQLVERWDFGIRSKLQRKDEFGEIGRSIDRFLDRLQESLSRVSETMDRVEAGDLGARVELETEGDLEHLKQSVNRSTASIQQIFQALDELMEQVARGDFSHRITLPVRGDLNHLKGALNHSLDALESAVREISTTASHMSEGDFTRPISGHYEGQLAVMKDAINATQGSLANVVAEVRAAADHVGQRVEDIAHGNHNLSERTSSQAASLEETAASMEQIAATVRENSTSIDEMKEQMSEVLVEGEHGREVVTSAIEAMGEISHSSKRISDIVRLIDEISFQTNLLALNAAVEAARAGKYGRGFAVVAEEVRNLARRTTEATAEITDLIEESVALITKGNRLVNNSGDALSVINQAVKEADETIANVVVAFSEQSTGIEQVNQAVTEIDGANQQNVHLVEEISNSSSELRQQAEGLVELMAFFQLDPGTLGRTHEAGGVSETFTKARSAHLAWKGKIRGFLNGMIEMDERQALSHHDCLLGKWLDSGGREQFSHLQEMVRLDQVHEEMHGLIQQIIKLKNRGQEEEADQEFSGIEPLSREVVRLLDRIEEQAVV